ncbi:G-type lectin S-receptor-like serine/threonine-protein kinase [Senna tora]|uniref:Receptor-like serine/threonine-protein kinase n=1 Tax=Senna tora TaxID=362788 RepID=A0A834TL67_9FABA|nr:G-type lectin S-receptor-like serine/threonine-protein kinase [Senna tora]
MPSLEHCGPFNPSRDSSDDADPISASFKNLGDSVDAPPPPKEDNQATCFLNSAPCCFLLLLTRSCLAGDSLKYGERITSKESSLVSIGGKFKMGFFSLGGTSERTYLGIWYYQVQPPTYVWVANRDNPIPNSIGVFEISDGNAQVTDPTSGQIYWSSNLPSSSSKNWTATLKDSGNLVLYDTGTSVQWQSFQEPTDTFLSGMKMNSQLISWKANDDPARGDYTFKLSRTGDRFVISKNYQSQHYWVSERLDSDATFLWMANAPINYAYDKLKKGNKKKEFNHSTVDYSNTRLFMNSSGHIQLVRWDDLTEEWILKWSEPADVCKQYNFCGSNSSCSIINSEHVCKCLPGFESIGEQECVRKSTSCATGNDRTFLNFTMMKVGDPDITVEEVKTEALCKSQCLERCPHCLAYSYYTSYIHRDSSLCLIWINDLPNLQEHIEYNDGGLDLSVLVNHSDIVLHGRSCEPCGTNEIPYPLSTGPDCGDPVYFNFRCNNLTGELSFMMPGGPYQVTSIVPNANNFIAQVNDSHYCGANNRKQQPHSPFRVTDWCRDGKEIVVSWEPPLEPSCNKSTDCTYWPNSICGSKFGAERRCLCQSNFHWNGSNLSCMPDEPSARKIPTSTLLLLILMLTIFILLASSIVAYVWRKKTAHSHNQDGGSLQRVHESLYDSVRHVKGLIGLGGLEEQEDNEGIGVPCFNFEAILAATENFSDANKLGQGGYGPVYKAWRLWTENNVVDLMDPCLRESCDANRFIRCANVGLLCVQDEPSDRPTMSNVVIMLESEIASIQTPKQPTFFMRALSGTASSSKAETNLQIESSYIQGR